MQEVCGKRTGEERDSAERTSEERLVRIVLTSAVDIGHMCFDDNVRFLHFIESVFKPPLS